MSQVASIKEVYLSNGGVAFPADYAIAGNPLIGLGYRTNKCSLKFTSKDPIKTNMNQEFPNLINVKAELETMQLPWALIKQLFGSWLSGAGTGVNLAVVTGKPVVASSNMTSAAGIFNFENTNSLGLDFELSITQKERLLKLTCERSFNPSVIDTMFGSAGTKTLPYAAGKTPMLDPTAVVAGFISPSFVSFGSDVRCSDFKISLKASGGKTAFDVLQPSKIDVLLEATLDSADLAEIKTNLAGSVQAASNVTISIANGETTKPSIILAKEGLSQKGEIEISDDKRTAKVSFVGSFFLDYVAVGTDTAKTITLSAFL